MFNILFDTWNFVRAVAGCNFLFLRTLFWWRRVYQPFDLLFQRSGYTTDLSRKCRSFIAAYVIPSLGPAPNEFTDFKPCSYMGDDHTPIEMSWVLNANEEHVFRFTMEPLSALDVSPTPSSTWMASLRSLSEEGCTEDFDLAWANICYETLVHDGILLNNISQDHSQSSVGTDFTHNGIVGKAYFLPHICSQASGKSQLELVTSCLTKLELQSQWSHVTKFLEGLPHHLGAVPEIVAVDCVEKTRNRAKVFIRSNAASFSEIIDLFTLGNTIRNSTVYQTVSMIREVWSSLFDSVNDDIHILSTNPDHYAIPKLYIPVRHYCENDATVGDALAQIYKQEEYSGDGDTYLNDIKAAFGRRELKSSRGLHTYIGIATRKGGPELSVYLSPLAFVSQHERLSG